VPLTCIELCIFFARVFEVARDECEAGCPLPLLASDLPRLQDGERECFSQGIERLYTVLTEALAALGRRTPQALGASALSEMIGAVCLARALGPTPASDAILAHVHESLISRLGL
jgi:TetR/AcrR family transcriptional regulator, transcriptional repressor for nem operon